MTPEIEVQKAIRARLIGNPAIIAMVPASNVLDTHGRPSRLPAIIMGDSQSVDAGTSLRRTHTRVYHTLHLWARETSMESVKHLAALIHAEMRKGRLVLSGGLHCADLKTAGSRFLRDPDGLHAHGVVTVEVLISEVPA